MRSRRLTTLASVEGFEQRLGGCCCGPGPIQLACRLGCTQSGVSGARPAGADGGDSGASSAYAGSVAAHLRGVGVARAVSSVDPPRHTDTPDFPLRS
jgi:hypothetical protein